MGYKFIVCTLYCGELDFPHHVEALKDQGVEVVHHVFRDMVEVDGHNAVYQTFNKAGPEWIRAKVDADVILNPNALASVANMVGHRTWLDPMVHDFFTNKALHAGIAIYGPGVTFRVQTLTLKCDRDVASCDPPVRTGSLGKHAHHADQWTGFRYGFHRGLKSQLPVYESVRVAYTKSPDPVRLAALRGFDLAQSDLYKDYHLGKAPPPMDHNYGNPRLRELFDQYCDPSKPLPPRTWR